MDNPTFGSAEEALEGAVRGVVQDVILAVAIEDIELAVGAVERPRRTIVGLLGVLARIGREVPFAELFAEGREFTYRMQIEVGDEERGFITMQGERESVGARKFRPGPLVHQFAGVVVEDDVVADVICQQDDLSVGRAGEAVAIVDRRLVIEHAPAGNDAILEVALAEDFWRGSLRERPSDRAIPSPGEQGVLQEGAAGERHGLLL